MGDPNPLPSRQSLARRPRRRVSTALRRQPILFWFLAALAAVSTFLVLESALEATTEGAEAYGELVEVVVARTDLEPGQIIDASEVERAALPASLVPRDALGFDPSGRAVRHPIVAGEAIVSRRLAPDGAVGIAVLLEPGERAVTIPMPGHRTPLEVGQIVDVLATVDPTQAAGRSPTSVVAENAVVVAVDDSGITVAASSADSARIATATAYAVINVAISG